MPSFSKSVKQFFSGTPEKRENVSTLREEQEPLYESLVNAGLAPGAGGSFGTAADYYRNLLSDNSADYSALAAPALRSYYQDIVPNISEQFAGMGAGSLNSSGFRNAQLQGATDLAERLGALRAQLRQAGAQGLANIGNLGLGQYSQNMITQHGSPGFLASIASGGGQIMPGLLSSGLGGGGGFGGGGAPSEGSGSGGGFLATLLPVLGGAATTALGVPGGPLLGSMAGQLGANWLSGGTKTAANTSPYSSSGSSSMSASPRIGSANLPGFLSGVRPQFGGG